MDRTVLFDVKDAKVYPLTADAGGGPTYGTAVDVPGITQVEITPNYDSSELPGDGTIIDSRTILRSIGLKFKYGKLDPDVLAVLDGGTVTQNTGTTVTRYERGADDQVPYFGFACSIVEVDGAGGEALLYVYKAKVEDGTLFGVESNSYGQPEFGAKAVALQEGRLWMIDLLDTATGTPADLSSTLTALV